ncbi:MAG: hypothetical protein RR766_00085 [Longicatena sp.]|uniref:hypothetical protein n=2 Tax=Anaerorhabdus sp. TaxID=1872524 RepID=UPI002FCAF4B6
MSEISLKFKVMLNEHEVNLGEVILNTEQLEQPKEKIPIELKTFTNDDVQDLLNTYGWKIDKLRKHGVLKGIQMGKGFIYPYLEIKKFLEEYQGMDLSNDQTIMESVHKVELAKIEQQLKFEKNQNKKSN